MNTKTLVDKLKSLIDNKSDDLTTDTVNIDEIKKRAKKDGYDDVIHVVGKDHTENFLLFVQKI